MSLAILFPGQGTQHPDTLSWLDGATESALDPLVDAFGADWRARLADTRWTRENRVAQPLITGLSLAAWQVLAPRLPAPTVVVGYSVGELASFHAAGVFDARQAMRIAERRAALMDASAQGHATGLLSLSNQPAHVLERICRTHRVVVAIRFAPDRIVVGGERSDLEAAALDAAASGADTCALAVSIASHTPWMRAAVSPFAAWLGTVHFDPPRIALVTDRDAGIVWKVDALKAALAEQIAEPIRWDDCMTAAAERGVACVLEMGPGTALSRLWNGRYPDIPARSVDEFKTPEAIARWVAARLR